MITLEYAKVLIARVQKRADYAFRQRNIERAKRQCLQERLRKLEAEKRGRRH